MPTPTLIATVGADDANSYATLDDAQAYHDAHLYADTWNDADDNTRTVALIQATRLLDQLFEWTGVQADADVQALRWPRIGMYDRDGNLLPSDELPVDLVNATAEYARQLMDNDRTADSEAQSAGITSLKAGSVYMTLRAATPKVLPDAVVYMLPESWGTKKGITGGSVTMRRA